ncbi:hypothetical protein EI555_021331 [Monodon monoceros]|uniref:Uncharacterized protein n=1 Tax=Monodon monoceros TaxID=40151 RepID=A0A4U1EGF3_MONMO|nr:hypothetical protein EI555_021331 [Monodon monoceros]
MLRGRSSGSRWPQAPVRRLKARAAAAKYRQAALEITARYCGRELEQYGQCVAAKPESWQRDCHHLKMSIAQCTSAHPVIRQIRQACAEPFEAFEECLRKNEAAVGNCAEHVRRFLQCAEQVQPTHTSSTAELCQHPFPVSCRTDTEKGSFSP